MKLATSKYMTKNNPKAIITVRIDALLKEKVEKAAKSAGLSVNRFSEASMRCYLDVFNAEKKTAKKE